MKLRTFFMAVMAGAALLVGCNKEVDFGPAKVALDQTNLAFEVAGGSQAVSLTATRDWAVNGVPEWVAVSATNGQAAVEAQPLKITVTQNAAYDRSATLVFTIGFARTSLVINQAGPNGQVDNGDGTLENPYNVTGVIEYLNELGADVNSPKKVFVKGKVSALASKESDQFGGTGNTFGNGSFTMSDDGSVNGGQFTAYRINYLGNKKFAAGDTPVKVGDEVIVYGNVVNYKGNTPETQQNQAFLYSLNGENRGGVDAGSGEDGEEVPDENLEPASDNNIAGLVAKIDKAATQSAPTAIADFALTGATVTYVNGSSAYIEDKSGAVLLYKSGHGLKAGDVLSGTLSTSGYYRYGVPQLTSLDGITPTAGEAPAPTEMTIEYLLSTYSSQLSRFLIIKDITVSTGMSGRNAVISQGDKSVNVYAALSSGLNLAQDATGDIIVFPTLYNTTKQVSFWDNSHFTGNGSEPGGDEPSDEYANAPAKTVEEFIQLADKENYYKLTGTVSKFNPTYCSFDLTDASGTIYVYSVLAAYKTDEWKNKIKDGGTITIAGKYDYYASKSQHEVVNAALLSFTDAEGGDEPGDEPGDVTPGTAGTYSFQFSDVSALSWPTAKGAGASTQVYPLNGVNYTFTLSDNVYTSTYSGSSYLMLASKTAAAPVYLGLPALEGLRLVKVAVTTSSGASKNAHGVVTSDLSGTVVSGGEDKTLSEQSTEYTWKLTGTEAGKVYYYSSPSASYNSQIVKLDLTYSDGEGGDEPGGDEPSDEYANAPAKTVEEFIQLADKENYYKLTGTVSKFNPTYCSFDLTDASGTIYVYSVLAAYKTDEWKNKIKDGGTITIAGKYDYYASKSQHEVINAALLSFTDAEGGDEPGTDEPSLPVNDGLTEATAFTVQDAIYMAKNGTEDKEYFVKAVVGKDISIKNGTASFELVDGTTDGKLTVVKAKSFGGEDFANDAPIEWLDEVILKGKVTEYSTLPALVNAQMVKWNGYVSFSGDEPAVSHAGTQADPYTVADAIASVANLTWTSKTDFQKVGPFYVKGKIASIKYTYSTQYGTATFDIADDGGTATFTCYSVKYFGGNAWVEGNTQVAVGDEVIIYGELQNYQGNTPETVSGAYVYSINGKTSDEPGDEPGDEPETTHAGTLEDPFSVADAIASVANLTWTSKTDFQKVGPFYVKGKIASIKYTYSAQYGTATFDIADDGGTATFTCYSVKYFGGNAWVEGNTQVAVGDEVIIYGELQNYQGNTPETVSGAYVYSINGKTSDEPGDEPGDEPETTHAGTLEDPFSVADAIASVANLTWTSKTDFQKVGPFYVKGKIASIKYTYSAQYGTATFDIADDGGTATFTCYSVKYFGGNAWVEGNTQVAVGDEVIIYGELQNYQGNTPETVSGAYVYSINGKTSDEGGDQPGGDEPEGGIYASTVAWTLGDKASSEKAIVNEVANVPVLKLGTSSVIGSATLTIPSGATKITFYAVSWSGKPSKLVFKNGDTELGSVSPAANTGLANTSPYTLTVTDADKYEITVSGATSITVQTDGSNKRAALFAIVSE